MESAPSLGLVAAEVVGELAAQERRSDALDSKAGIVLGFAGVIAGLSADRIGGLLGKGGLVAAAVAALLAVSAFIPRSFPNLGPMHLRRAYLALDPDLTTLKLLDTRIAIYASTQNRLERKALYVRLAAAVLALAVLLVVAGAIVD